MSKWQPIETAPKNKKIILLINGIAIEGNYDHSLVHRPENERWECEILPSHGCGCCSYQNDNPTHWMPLPEAPEVENYGI